MLPDRLPTDSFDGDDCEYEYQEVEQDNRRENSPDRLREPRTIAERFMADVDETFRRCHGLTYIFFGWGVDRWDQINTIYPDVMAAIPLLDAALQRTTLNLPAHRQSLTTSTLDPTLGSVAEEAIFAKIVELERRHAHFVLVWALSGDTHARVAGDLDDLADQVIDLVSDEVREYLNV